MATIDINDTYDLEQLDEYDLSRGDRLTLTYHSQRTSEEVERTVKYRRHLSEGWIGRLACMDGDQLIELDRDLARKGTVFLVSKGQRAINLGTLRRIEIHDEGE